jgi:hypothetical protein
LRNLGNGCASGGMIAKTGVVFAQIAVVVKNEIFQLNSHLKPINCFYN